MPDSLIVLSRQALAAYRTDKCLTPWNVTRSSILRALEGL